MPSRPRRGLPGPADAAEDVALGGQVVVVVVEPGSAGEHQVPVLHLLRPPVAAGEIALGRRGRTGRGWRGAGGGARGSGPARGSLAPRGNQVCPPNRSASNRITDAVSTSYQCLRSGSRNRSQPSNRYSKNESTGGLTLAVSL